MDAKACELRNRLTVVTGNATLVAKLATLHEFEGPQIVSYLKKCLSATEAALNIVTQSATPVHQLRRVEEMPLKIGS